MSTFLPSHYYSAPALVTPRFRQAPAYRLAGFTPLPQQSDTVVGDLVIVAAFSTSGVTPDEATPAALMTTEDTDATSPRRGRLAWRIATTGGAASLSNWTGTPASHFIITIEAGTFDPSDPITLGGNGFFVGEPDTSIPWPALSDPSIDNALAVFLAYSNLGPAAFGQIAGTSDLCPPRSTVSHYSRGMYRTADAAISAVSVPHISGSAAQVLGCAFYVNGPP